MYLLILLGLCAALFFSSTFILNSKMSLEGGNWMWSALLRYGFMFALLAIWILLRHGQTTMIATLKVFWKYAFYWVIAGSIGFGFYAPCCYAADHAPAWVVACTWQLTTLMTPLILLLYGKRVPRKGIALILMIAVGAVLANLDRASTVDWNEILLGGLPILLGAIAYPLGNQAAKEMVDGTTRWLPHIQDPVVRIPSVQVFLMTLGSMPLWIGLWAWMRPPAPSEGQLLQTFLVALFSGLIGTSIFYKARAEAKTPSAVAAVDATQAGETIFTFAGEILFLGALMPGVMGITGLLLICVGLVLYAKS